MNHINVIMTKSNERTHTYMLPLPPKVYETYKIRAVKKHTTLKEELLKSLIKDIETDIPKIENPAIFSEKAFAIEWDSPEDEEAFAHFQKYARK